MSAGGLKLSSDFADYYDCFFDRNSDEVFSRRSDQGMSRPEMLIFLQRSGFDLPLHGRVDNIGWDLKRKYLNLSSTTSGVMQELSQVVVYLNNRSHRGEDKIKIPYSEALKKYPSHYCTEYIGPVACNSSVTLRLLQVGVRRFWLRYTSTEDWRSNYGNGDIVLLGEDNRGYHPRIQYPLFAVDFASVAGVGLYALDFNESPQIMGTPVAKEVPAEEIYKLIVEASREFRSVKAEF